MNYERIYSAFILDRRAKENTLCGQYTEKHHILPRALGGGDEPENIIRLTPEDHFFAHLLLAKIHGGKMWYGLMAMCADRYGKRESKGYLRRRRKAYAKVRAEYGAAVREQVAAGEHHTSSLEWREAKSKSEKQKGELGLKWAQSPEGRARISELSKAWWAANPATPERRAAMSARVKGVPKNPEAVAKQAATLRGRKATAETRAKMSASHKAREWTAEDQARITASNKAQVWTEERRQRVKDSNRIRGVSAETRAKISEAHKARGDMAARNKARVWDEAAREKIAAFHRAKAAYSAKHGVPHMRVTKAMVESEAEACQ